MLLRTFQLVIGELIELTIDRRLNTFFGQSLRECFDHHGHGATHEISQIVGEITVDALNQSLIGEVAVRAEGNLTQQKVADGIDTVFFN